MKPGPPRICDCGCCPRCKKRRIDMAYYHRNAQAVAKKNTEAKKRRLATQKQKHPKALSDREMDRLAAEWLSRQV